MVQVGSHLKVADNSGARELLIINIPGASRKKYAHVGDIVTVVVKGALPYGEVKDGSVQKAVIVRVKKEFRRKDGSYIRFDNNAAVVVDKDKNPRSTRILGPIAREVKELGYAKIASLAEEVL